MLTDYENGYYTSMGAYVRKSVRDFHELGFGEINDDGTTEKVFDPIGMLLSPLLIPAFYFQGKKVLKTITPQEAIDLEQKLGRELTIH